MHMINSLKFKSLTELIPKNKVPNKNLLTTQMVYTAPNTIIEAIKTPENQLL